MGAMDDLLRNVETAIGAEELEQRINDGKRLKVKFGVDPTRPDLTFGHLVVFNKLREFQELGHEAILLLGDYTAQIGDPSGQSDLRPALTKEQVEENASTYLDQAFKILNTSNQSFSEVERQFKVESVYGYIPNTVTFPSASYNSLPSNISSIINDINRRKGLLNLIEEHLLSLIHEKENSDIVPFAIPIKMDQNKILKVKNALCTKFNAEAEILNFDFNQNMLNTNYEKALVLGCHSSWKNHIFQNLGIAK